MYRLLAKSPSSHHILFYLIISHLILSYFILSSSHMIPSHHITSYRISPLTPPMKPHNVASHRIASPAAYNSTSPLLPLTFYLTPFPSPPLPSATQLAYSSVLFRCDLFCSVRFHSVLLSVAVMPCFDICIMFI